MYCPNCGKELSAGASFCPECGASINNTAPSPQSQSQPLANTRPLSPWAYFGLELLFAIPLVGFILAIVFSFDDSNINRRNFARSYWCGLLLAVIVIIIITIIGVAIGAAFWGAL